MPGTLPHNNFGKVVIKSAMPTITTVSISGQRQSKGVPAQYWQISAEYATLTREQFNEVMGFLQQQRGSLYQFDVIIPELSRPAGEIRKAFNPTTSPQIWATSARTVGSTSIAITSVYVTGSNIAAAGGDTSKAFRAGDFIKFASHSKVYQIVENAAMAGSSTTLNIYPALIYPIGTSEAITINNVPFQVFNLNDTQEYSYSTGRSNNIILELQEAF
jgi:hypothetical protein